MFPHRADLASMEETPQRRAGTARALARGTPYAGSRWFAMIGRKVWAIAEGYIPSAGVERDPAFVPHETACMLNAGELDAQVEIMIYYQDREPVGPYRATVPRERTLHLRFNDLDDPAPIPRDTDYSCVIRSDQPIVVQHTRLDSRRSELAVLTTTAYSE
jgi:hypothetical protein